MQTTAAEPRPLSQRIIQTFVAPRRLAAGFLQHSPAVGALAITTLIAMLTAAARPDDFFLSQMEDPVDRRGNPVELTSPPEQVVFYGRLMAMLSALAGHPLIVITTAGVLTLVFGVLGGGRTEYRQYLALAAHASLIPAVGALLNTALQWTTGNALAHLSLATPFGIAGRESASWLVQVLENLDPFTLWMLVVLAVGVGTLEERRSTVRAAAVLLGAYLLLAVVLAGLV